MSNGGSEVYGYPNHWRAYMSGVQTGVLLGGLITIANAVTALGEAGRVSRELSLEGSALIEQVVRFLLA